MAAAAGVAYSWPHRGLILQAVSYLGLELGFLSFIFCAWVGACICVTVPYCLLVFYFRALCFVCWSSSQIRFGVGNGGVGWDKWWDGGLTLIFWIKDPRTVYMIYNSA